MFASLLNAFAAAADVSANRKMYAGRSPFWIGETFVFHVSSKRHNILVFNEKINQMHILLLSFYFVIYLIVFWVCFLASSTTFVIAYFTRHYLF